MITSGDGGEVCSNGSSVEVGLHKSCAAVWNRRAFDPEMSNFAQSSATPEMASGSPRSPEFFLPDNGSDGHLRVHLIISLHICKSCRYLYVVLNSNNKSCRYFTFFKGILLQPILLVVNMNIFRALKGVFYIFINQKVRNCKILQHVKTYRRNVSAPVPI
jgi:hypothetical protein